MVVVCCHNNPTVVENINPVAPGESLVPGDTAIPRDVQVWIIGECRTKSAYMWRENEVMWCRNANGSPCNEVNANGNSPAVQCLIAILMLMDLFEIIGGKSIYLHNIMERE